MAWGATNIFIAASLCFALTCGAASNPDAAFDAANKLYAENKFAEAAAAYEGLAQSGSVSPALLFNLGNAHYKAGHVGQAIAAYRRAAQLAPRDTDLRANLQFVRSQVQGPTLRPGGLSARLALMSLNEWTGAAAAGLWLTFGLLAARQFKPALGIPLRTWTRLAIVVTVLCVASLAMALNSHASGRLVVVTAREATVRISPLEGAPKAFSANDGAELRVLDRKGDWLQITDGSRLNGWVSQQQVQAL
jgi:tetratricopeptide (TPR) repeat protein